MHVGTFKLLTINVVLLLYAVAIYNAQIRKNKQLGRQIASPNNVIKA